MCVPRFFIVFQMMWPLNIYAICFAFGLNTLSINIVNAYTETVITKESHSDKSPKFIEITFQEEANSSTYITNVLETARSKIKYETPINNFAQTGVYGLKDLVMESGGQPLRTLIISSWRSGSTFLGDLINAVPSTYYHYEPLLKIGIKQIREPEEAREPLDVVKRMFNCDFEGLESYLTYQNIDFDRFKHPTILFHYCKDGNRSELCLNPEFTSRLCKLFPFQSMKLVRLRLRLIEKILNDKQ